MAASSSCSSAPVGHVNHEADILLARAILARDRKATARFVELHADRVHGYVWRRLEPKTDSVDDIVQEVFLSSWRSLQTYSGQAPLEAWILGIARFKVEDYYRRALNSPLAAMEMEEDSPILAYGEDLEGELDSLREAGRAVAILEELSYEYAVALRWRYWEGQSAKSMAAATGRSEKAVERLLARAREKFRLRWIEMAGEGAAQ